MLPSFHVLGSGFFAPDYDSVEDAFADRRRVEPRAPEFALVTGRLRRFTSLVTQMHLEVCGQALRVAGSDGSAPHTVFASELGETTTTIELLRGMADQGVASAARFAQSVHSTPSGIFSIATGNRHASQAVAAGEHTFAAALLETRLIALETGGPVLLSIADDAAPALLGSARPGAALAAAFVIANDGPVPRSTWSPPPSAPHLRGSALLPALALLREVAC